MLDKQFQRIKISQILVLPLMNMFVTLGSNLYKKKKKKMLSIITWNEQREDQVGNNMLENKIKSE